MTDKIDDHVDQALSRLPQQHKGKTNTEKLLSALVRPIQGVEDGLWQLLTERSIDNAVGKQLDTIGVIVGQRREGLADETYRRYLRARIMTNRSNGLVDDLIRVAKLILNEPSALIVVDQQFPAANAVKIFDNPVDNDVANVLISFLRDATSGGVRVLLETTTGTEDDTFYFPTSDIPDASDPGKGMGDFHDSGAGGIFAFAKEEPRDLVVTGNTHSLSLDSSQSQHVIIPDSPDLDPASFTYFTQFYLTSRPSSGSDVVLSDRKAGAGGWRVFFVASGAGPVWLIRCFVGNTTDNYLVTYNGALEINTWNDIAFIYDDSAASMSTAVRLMLNGVDEGNGAVVVGNGADVPTPLADAASDLLIGCQLNLSAFVGGFLDNTRFWSNAQTVQQVIDSRNKELNGNEAGLVFEHRYNNDLIDSSGNGHNGTAVNGASFSDNTPF